MKYKHFILCSIASVAVGDNQSVILGYKRRRDLQNAIKEQLAWKHIQRIYFELVPKNMCVEKAVEYNFLYAWNVEDFKYRKGNMIRNIRK